MLKRLVSAVILLIAFSCHAEEVRIACLFDRPIAPPEMDAEAESLSSGFQASNLERVVMLELNPPAKLLNNDMLFRLFPDGATLVRVSEDSILVGWGNDQHPRRPAMNLSVNRFSLEAVEYFQIKKPGTGQAVYSWTRSGKCKVDKRKF